LHTASEELHEKVAKAEQTAQSEVDKAYAPVHSATAGIKTPLAPLKAVVDVAKSQADPTSSPIFKSIINEGDSVSSTDGVLIVDGQYRPVFSGGKQILFSDPNFAEAYESQYKEPPPLVGGETDFPRLQRWYTYINSKIYGGGRLEYGTYNALKMTRDAIADSMRSITDASGDVVDPNDPSKKVSVTSLWDKARKLHTEKMEAFSDSPNEPQTNASKLLSEKTPQLSKEKAQEKRLKMIAQVGNDPTIIDIATKIDDIDNRLKKTRNEEQLRKRLPKPIPPPSLDHPDDTYRLKPEPEPFTGKPVERDEPTGPRKHDPEGKTLWAEDALKDKNEPVDYSEKKAERLKAFQKMTKEYGLRRAIYASFTSIPAAIVTALLGHPKVAALEAGVGPAVLLGSQVLANLMDKPEVAAWVEKVTPKDVAEFDKLPPEQKALFTQDMRDLADAAAKKGKPVSPALTRFLGKPVVKWGTRAAGAYAGVANANRPSLEEMKKKAADLLDQMYKSGLSPKPPDATPAPQPAAQPAYTHTYDPDTGQIVAVQ
jgi:hypothetical protein